VSRASKRNPNAQPLIKLIGQSNWPIRWNPPWSTVGCADNWRRRH